MTLTLEEQAWTHHLLLRIGIGDVASIIAWADESVMHEPQPPGWLIDVSLAAGESEYEMSERLKVVDDRRLDHRRAAWAALARIAELWRSSRVGPLAGARLLYEWSKAPGLSESEQVRARTPEYVADDVIEGIWGSSNDVKETIDRVLPRLLDEHEV